MDALLEKLQETIVKLYGSEVVICLPEHYVRFALHHPKKWRANVTLIMFERTPAALNTAAQYALTISFSFATKKGRTMEVTHRPHNQSIELCHHLQKTIDWGVMKLLESTDERIGFELIRTVNTSLADLDKTGKNVLNTELRIGLESLTEEYAKLYPIIYGYADGSITSFGHLDKLIETPPTPQLM